MHVESGDAAGPPPTPSARRQRKRRNLAIIAAVVLIGGVPLTLAVIGSTTDADRDQDTSAASDEDVAAGDDRADSEANGDARADGDSELDAEGDADADRDVDAGEDRGGDADEDLGGDDSIGRLDPDGLDGADADFAQLLGDIDASERAMIGFQDALRGAFLDPFEDAEATAGRIQEAAGGARDDLLAAREPLTDELADDGAEAVRAIYLDHLDSWADYMGAVEENPGILGSEDRTRGFILAINVTADAFARSLEAELPEDVDAEVRRFADDLLDRGFRGLEDATV